MLAPSALARTQSRGSGTLSVSTPSFLQILINQSLNWLLIRWKICVSGNGPEAAVLH